MTAPITDAGLAELADMLAEAKRGRTGLGYNGQHVNGLGFWLIGNAPYLVHRLRTSEAENVALRARDAGWTLQSEEQEAEIAALRARAEKAEAEVARLVAALTDTRACLLAGGMTARMEAIGGIDAYLAASRPDSAQPGLSGAKTAAERAVLDATMRLWWNNFTLPKSVADACAALDRITGAAPPAAGSAAGKGE